MRRGGGLRCKSPSIPSLFLLSLFLLQACSACSAVVVCDGAMLASSEAGLVAEYNFLSNLVAGGACLRERASERCAGAAGLQR